MRTWLDRQEERLERRLQSVTWQVGSLARRAHRSAIWCGSRCANSVPVLSDRRRRCDRVRLWLFALFIRTWRPYWPVIPASIVICGCTAAARQMIANMVISKSATHSFIGGNAVMGAGGGVRIGNNVLIGQSVHIHAENHNFADATRRINEQGVTYQEVVIEDDVWIGSRAMILAGVTIGRGAVIGGGAVVTTSIPPYSIAVGVPARVVGQRGAQRENRHLSQLAIRRRQTRPARDDAPSCRAAYDRCLHVIVRRA